MRSRTRDSGPWASSGSSREPRVAKGSPVPSYLPAALGTTLADLGKVELRPFKDVDLRGGTVVEAIPSVGLVSTIAATYMITTLSMDQVVAMESEEFPALSMVYAAKPKFPVRMYAEAKSKLAVFISEVPLALRAHRMVARALLDWTKAKHARQIVSLEGLPLPEAATREAVRVWAVGSTDSARKAIGDAGLGLLETGLIAGVSGVLLNEGRWQNFDVICLLAEARPNMPDAFAAARLLEALDRLLPEIQLDLGPLEKQAAELEATLQRMRHEARSAVPEEPPRLSKTPGPDMFG